MINLSDAQKQFGEKIILDRVNTTIDPSWRTGLIGVNGTGKTVFLRIIAGEEELDGGQISRPGELRLGYLPQEMTFDESMSPLKMVLQPFEHLINIDEKVEKLVEKHEGDQESAMKALEKIDELHTERSLHGGDSLEPRARKYLKGLGVPEQSWERSIVELSGGFRMRVVLARLLLMNPDLLLLDEPTNHLDMDSLFWLERFLQKFRGGVLAVSHDRGFLNRCMTHTLELERGGATIFRGNVKGYLEWKEQKNAADESRTRSLQSQIQQTERFIERFKAKSTKATQAKSKMKQLERLKEELPDTVRASRMVNFRLPEPTRCGSVPIKLESVTVGYGKDPVLKDLSVQITRGDKIAVIGPNGAGKSTFLKACAGQLEVSNGSLSLGHNAEVRYYSQHRLEQLDPQRSVYETIADVTGSGDRNFIQSVLGAFFFTGSEVDKPVGVLSGGEKSRLSLATLLARPGNVLLLDEPTNHLDIYSVEALADMLAGFAGTIVVVSHDEFFISRIANRLIEIRPGAVRDFPGSPDDYREYLEQGYLDPLESQSGSSTEEPMQQPLDKTERVRLREERTRVRRRIEKLEKMIAENESETESVETRLNDPSNASNFSLLTNLQDQLSDHQEEYDELLTEWDELQGKLEELEKSL